MPVFYNHYLIWKKEMDAKIGFRRFWVFWGIYSALIFVLIGVYFFSLNGGLKIVLLAIASALFCRYVVCELIVLFYKKPHPYQRLNFQPPTSWLFSFSDSRKDAFPSEHAAFFASMVPIIWYLSPLLGLLGVLVLLMIGLARIRLGYHDYYDILAGWMVGLFTGFLTLYVSVGFW